jgi:hypothetical protein
MKTLFNFKTNAQKFSDSSNNIIKVFTNAVNDLMLENSKISEVSKNNTEQIIELETENEELTKIKNQNENIILKIKNIYE